MAGFEVIVRPVVFPNIRPSPTRSLPPADDPEQGQAVFSGGSGQVIALTHSFSASASSSGGSETKRTYDVARIYQQDADGNVNRDNYVDVEVAKKFKMKAKDGSIVDYEYGGIEDSDKVTILERNQTRIRESGTSLTPVRRGRR
jgi:hypothetical protein